MFLSNKDLFSNIDHLTSMRKLLLHPRSRGEHISVVSVCPNIAGSSPLPRGTSKQEFSLGAPDRFIPAPAGNMEPTGDQPAAGPVHPRSRGEHFLLFLSQLWRRGSSPLPRGTFLFPSESIPIERFIPAPAGNISLPKEVWKTQPVHPRSRGEHSVADL